MTQELSRGDVVDKIKGHEFPGIVVSVFKTIDATKQRLVVQSTIIDGLLFILAPEQLVWVDRLEVCQWCDAILEKNRECERHG